MSSNAVSERTGFERFREEFAQCWKSLPYKGLFLAVLGAWLLLFHFLGNSTLGYTNTPSLFLWLDWVIKQAEDDQHGPWMLVVVLVLLWWKRRELLDLPKRNWLPGLVILGAAILVHALGYMVQQTRISLVGFFLGIYGMIGLVWGPQMLRATFFPIFLFAFCMPTGGTLGTWMTLPLRMVATKITTMICHGILGIQVIQEGTRLLDANHTYSYEVAAACSGIRSLTATLAIAFIYAFVVLKSPWKRLIMIGSTIPLAIIANVVRLTTIIVTSEVFGQAAGEYVHESWWISLIPYIPLIGGILLVGHWLREKPIVRQAGRQVWSNAELGIGFGCVAAVVALREFLPTFKSWTAQHPCTFVLILVGLAMVALWWLTGRTAPVQEPSFSSMSPAAVRQRWSAVCVGMALALIALTAMGLHYRQGHQKLGAPGVKVVQVPIFDPQGNIAASNSVALPERVVGYESKATPLDRIVLDWLPKDTTYGQRVYKAPDGFQTQMTVVLMGADRTSIHQPQYCLVGNGWKIEQSEFDTIPVNQPRVYQLPVQKLTASRVGTFEDGSVAQVSAIYVYWFVAENRLTANHGQRMLEMGLDMLRTGVLQRWAYVSCFAICAPGQEAATYGRIKDLIVASVPEFQLTTGEPARLASNP